MHRIGVVWFNEFKFKSKTNVSGTSRTNEWKKKNKKKNWTQKKNIKKCIVIWSSVVFSKNESRLISFGYI